MIIRQTRTEDIDQVMEIYARAAHFMAQTGNPNQWAAGYPSRDMIMDDIVRGVSFVMEENGRIEAVFAYIEGVDSTYINIINGAWKSNGRYGTIHRLASAGRRRGIARQCFLWCEQQALAHGCVSLRVDTHMDNKIMQRVVSQSGFLYCGVIHLANGAPRLAYEHVLEQKTGTGIALGVTSMVLGIVSLLMFCTCINFVTAIAAIVFGIVQIVKNKEKSFAIVGISTAVISLLLAIAMWGMVTIGMSEMGVDSYEEFLDNYYDNYTYDEYNSDDYNNRDFDDEYYFEEESGAEFL